MKIGIIGCGNLGTGIALGLLDKNPSVQLIASRRSWEEINLDQRIKQTTDNAYVLKHSDFIIISLKPYSVIQFLTEHKDLLQESKHTIISAATGITLDEMQEVIGTVDCARVMPNTAAEVGESITAISIGRNELKRKDEINQIFESIGSTIFINESLMESATVLGACGIAYVLRFMRAMIQGGIEVGFDAKSATKIVAQTVKGAAELIIQNETHPEQEIDKVTTPKGCTIVGLNEMEHSGFSSALIKGLVTSYQKIEK